MKLTDEAGRASALAARAQLVLVRLLSVDMSLLGEFDAGVTYRVAVNKNTSWTFDDKGDLRFLYEAGIIVSTADEEEPPIFTAAPRFEALYHLLEEYTFSEDEAQAFAESVLMLTVHPYVRELVQSLTVRAGLPPLTLGAARLPLLHEEYQDMQGE